LPESHYSGSGGEIRQILYDKTYNNFQLSPGSTVVLTGTSGTIRTTLVPLTAHLDLKKGVLKGTAPPLSRIYVYFPYGMNPTQVITTNAQGVFSNTFPGPLPTYSISGEIFYLDLLGNQTILQFGSNHWDLVLNSPCLSGTSSSFGGPITVTLRTADGSHISTFSMTNYYRGNQFNGCFDVPVHANDHLTLQEPSQMTDYTVPELTAVHNYPRQALEGIAPANGSLVAYFYNLQTIFNGGRNILVQPDGHFGVDTSDLKFNPTSYGLVIYTDDIGNTVTLKFNINVFQVWLLPVIAK
jgi:hypothetical protein